VERDTDRLGQEAPALAVDEAASAGSGERAADRGGVAVRSDAPPATMVPDTPGSLIASGKSRWRRWLTAAAESAAGRHLALLACYLAAGVAVTWPRATWLVDGKLQATRDAGTYVWDFWWMAHAVEHLTNPWYTRAITAPVGVQLGYHALMPLEGVLMLPVTAVFGPSVSYNLLSVLMPGLLCYAMYRVARLWLRSETGAIAAGGFFGLSSIMAWHAWYQLNLAAGVLFLPLALEAAVRLRRNPSWRRAALLGLVMAGCLLTDQESAVLMLMLVAPVLLTWLVRAPRAAALARIPGLAETGWLTRRAAREPAPAPPDWRRRLCLTGLAGAVMLLVASPQIAAMVAETHSGGATFPQAELDVDYALSGTNFPGIFGVSPRAVRLGLSFLKPISYRGPLLDGVLTFGLVVSVLAVFGLITHWRRRSAWLLFLLWLASAALALGSVLKVGTRTYVPLAEVWHGVQISALLPFTWFVQVPGMAGFREAARLTMLGIVPASLLAGAAIDWLRYRIPPLLIPVLVAAVLEAGWAGNLAVGTIPTAWPRVDGPIAADHSQSIVVDVPFGIRGGVPLPGEGAAFVPQSEVLATADGHPRAVGYLSRLPAPTLGGIRRHPFYAGLLTAQGQPLPEAETLTHTTSDTALIAAARADARRMHVGWVIVWRQSPDVLRYLARTGFHVDYRVGRILVYRPAAGHAAGASLASIRPAHRRPHGRAGTRPATVRA
jgi:hypothetical protein